MDHSENPKLEWMYKTTGKDLINREEYLVGRKVDKQFEESNENIIESKVLPTSIVNRNRNCEEVYDKSKDQVDILRKQMEDPLIMIKQKEIEAKRKILENPVKLKKLHELLKKDTIANQKKAKGSKDKKFKKKKKKSGRSSETTSSNSDQEEDLDKILLKKYKALQNKSTFDTKKDSSFVDKKYFALTKELDKIVKTKNSKHRRRSPSKSPIPRKEMKRSRSKERDRDDKYSRRRKSKSKDPDHGKKRDYRNKSPPRTSYSREEARNYGLITADGEKIELKNKNDVKWYSKSELKGKTTTSTKDHHKRDELIKSKLTGDEMMKKRQEMMQNASWREKDREETVKKYRKSQREEENVQRTEFDDKHFLNRHLKKAHEQVVSIETRIKSNLNNIQRSKGTMDLNFAKR